MADPISIVSDLLAPVFAEIAGRPDEHVDPVVRPSERADAQVNGALPLAKQIGSELSGREDPDLAHDSSTNNLIRRYRRLRSSG